MPTCRCSFRCGEIWNPPSLNNLTVWAVIELLILIYSSVYSILVLIDFIGDILEKSTDTVTYASIANFVPTLLGMIFTLIGICSRNRLYLAIGLAAFVIAFISDFIVIFLFISIRNDDEEDDFSDFIQYFIHFFCGGFLSFALIQQMQHLEEDEEHIYRDQPLILEEYDE